MKELKIYIIVDYMDNELTISQNCPTGSKVEALIKNNTISVLEVSSESVMKVRTLKLDEDESNEPASNI